MKLPPTDQIETALLWLRSNEDDGHEKASCEATADWLEKFADDTWLRHQARTAGVPVSSLRRKLAEQLPNR